MFQSRRLHALTRRSGRTHLSSRQPQLGLESPPHAPSPPVEQLSRSNQDLRGEWKLTAKCKPKQNFCT